MPVFSSIRYILKYIASGLFFGTKMKGKFSEELAYRKMLELPDEYHIFNNLFFESNGYSTQIDHVVVSPYGVFVIETKGYKGWILGGENSEYWTQVLYDYKYRFYNPIKQNEGHVRKIKYLLQNSVNIPIIQIVVFNNEAELKINVPNHIVVNRYYLTSAILRYQESVISNDTKQWIVETLNKHLVYEDRDKASLHAAKVRYRAYRNVDLSSQGICPECGGKLVERHGKYGIFWGCSNYPKCRFTTR